MFGELRSQIGLVGFALSRLRLLGRAPFGGMFLRYYLIAGVESLGSVALRAALVGALIIGYVVNVIAADAESAVHLLQSVVMREVGPMLAAVIVMSKAGIEIAGQFAVSRQKGEIAGLALLKVPMRELLVLPCVGGVAAALFVLTLYFELLASLGGILIASILTDLSVAELAERFALQIDLMDLLYPMFKSLIFGLALGAVTAHHGLTGPAGRDVMLARTMARYIVQSLFVLSLINAFLGYVLNGQVFFGVVKV